MGNKDPKTSFYKRIIKESQKEWYNLILIITQFILFFVIVGFNYNFKIDNLTDLINVCIFVCFVAEIFFLYSKFYPIFLFLKSLMFYYTSLSINLFEPILIITLFQFSNELLSQSRYFIYSKKRYFLLPLVGILCFTSYVLRKNEFNNATLYLILLYPYLHLLIMWAKSFKRERRFCIDRNLMQIIIGKLQTFELSFVFFNLIIIFLIFLLNDIALWYLFLLIPIVFYTAIVEIKFIIYHYKKNSMIYFRHYVIATCYSAIIIVSYWLNTISIQPENYSNIISNTMTFIISIAIFNIASLLVLLQLNYNKFGSHYLVLKILTSPVVAFLTMLPSSLIMFNYFFLNPNFHKPYIPTLLIISSLLSSLGLLLLFRRILGTNLLLEKLFKDIDENDFKTYRKNNIHENKIDIVLKITTDIINKNDSISSHSLFLHLACWMKNNISLINDQFDHRHTKQETKFTNFFDDIVNRLSETNNSIIKLNFLISMRKLLLLDIDQENFKPYEVIYNYLFKYLYLTLRKGDDENAIEIYQVIYKRAPNILLNLPEAKIGKYNTVKSSDEFYLFKKIFFKPIREMFDIGKENKNIKFLKNINLYDDLFVVGYKDEESFTKWDGKVLDIYVQTRINTEVMNYFLLENDVSWFDIKQKYELFLYYSKFDTKNNKSGISNNLNKYLADNLLSLFIYGIKKDKLKYESDLGLFWEHLFYGVIKENYLKEFKEYFTLYTLLIFHVFDHEFSKDKSKNSEEKPNIRLIYDLWGRFNQFVNHDEINEERIEFKEFVDTKRKSFINKFSRLEEIEKIEPYLGMVYENDIVRDYAIEKLCEEKKVDEESK